MCKYLERISYSESWKVLKEFKKKPIHRAEARFPSAWANRGISKRAGRNNTLKEVEPPRNATRIDYYEMIQKSTSNYFHNGSESDKWTSAT